MSQGPQTQKPTRSTCPSRKRPLLSVESFARGAVKQGACGFDYGEKQGGTGSMDGLQGRPLELVWARVSDIPQTPS